ncbi:MAG: hypothetical protein DSY43_01190 [Gammaproteobacteria bacterium]|nr:MAG: hypothetical protein DSY43_01190 [Gammaproteobacteria bacterium]
MIDLKSFCSKIEQAPNNGVESAKCDAIKFDDQDGFVRSLTANYANQCRVDYFEKIEQGVILIELKDIKSKIKDLLKDKKDKEEIQKKVSLNLEKKFIDSLKIIQQEIDSNLIPVINYLVVTNDTESNLLDKYLPKNLKKKPFVICKTNEIRDKLSTLGTRLCQ